MEELKFVFCLVACIRQRVKFTKNYLIITHSHVITNYHDSLAKLYLSLLTLTIVLRKKCQYYLKYLPFLFQGRKKILHANFYSF